ncbi:DUF1214 domain-containing protein [Falsihalocynthiibacter sp. S25ZX9]|uniref:DUF1214 domain-containing protein n=1 Tax=Falsihalocynthiibacter sp. S25ZX9 TaxID=3240870 RepID=UPI00350E9B42
MLLKLVMKSLTLAIFTSGLSIGASAQVASGDIRAALDADEYPSMLNSVPVSLENFPTAETHHMMQVAIENIADIGDWAHVRDLTPIDGQNVVRMNRDTLYSSVILDLSTPAVLIKNDVGDRYQSVLIINEGHFARKVIYEPGEYELTQEDLGSRYVVVIVRTLVDAEDPEDVSKAHAAQDALSIVQADKGQFEVPNWDQSELELMRDALKTLGRFLQDRDSAFGASMEEVDPTAFLISSADTWGGWKPEHAVYQNRTPALNDGKTPHVLTLTDVPSAPNAFWSISVYNADGFFQKNEFDKYVVNSRKAETDADGNVTIHFGGDPSQPNFLPIMDDWNYMLRIYLPQEAYFSGSWTASEATPAN